MNYLCDLLIAQNEYFDLFHTIWNVLEKLSYFNLCDLHLNQILSFTDNKKNIFELE